MKEREDKEYRHKSYGVLRFSRKQGGRGKNFFASSIQPDSFIELNLHNGELITGPAGDRVYARGRALMTVSMSNAQFSELITTMNYGSGAPCTIDYLNGEKIEQAEPIDSRKHEAYMGFKQRLDYDDSKLDEAIEKISNTKLSKKMKEELISVFSGIRQDLKSNAPYFLSLFQEYMDKIVVEAKQEIDSQMTNTVMNAGLKALDINNEEIE